MGCDMMDIRYSELFEIRQDTIPERFKSLMGKYSLQESIKYMDFVRSQTPETILENSTFIYVEPRSGADFLLSVMKTNDLPVEVLKKQRDSIDHYLKNCTTKGYDNEAHMQSLRECVEFLDKEIMRKSSYEYIKEDTIYNLHISNIRPIFESSIQYDMDEIIQNINYKPEMAEKYEKLVESIKQWDATMAIINFIPMLIKNTSLIIGVTISFATAFTTLLISVPVLLVSKLIQNSIDKSKIKSYIAVIDKQIRDVEAAIREEKNADKKKLLNEYLNSLKTAKTELVEYKNNTGKKSTTESSTDVEEGIGEMCPVVGYETVYGYGCDDDYEDLEYDDEDDDECEDYDCDDDNDEIEEELYNLENEFAIQFVDLFMDPDEEITTEGFDELVKIAYNYSALTEGTIGKAARKIARAGEKTVQGATKAIRKAGSELKHAGVVVARIPDSMDNLVNNTLNKLKQMSKEQRRKEIIEGGFRVKLFKIIRNAILAGVAFKISPALAAVGLVTSVGISTHIDNKIRRELIHELEQELAICNEKIEDARGDSNKQKKYELMRLKNKLEDSIAKIKYRLD